jgi:hypothetical protein
LKNYVTIPKPWNKIMRCCRCCCCKFKMKHLFYWPCMTACHLAHIHCLKYGTCEHILFMVITVNQKSLLILSPFSYLSIPTFISLTVLFIHKFGSFYCIHYFFLPIS